MLQQNLDYCLSPVIMSQITDKADYNTKIKARLSRLFS